MAKFIEPAQDRILVIDNARLTTIDDIELPGNVREKDMAYGTVVSVGPLSQERVKPREIVLYGPYAGKMVAIEGVEFRILREDAIEGWVREKTEGEVV